MNIIFPILFIEETILFLLNILGSLIKYESTVYTWVYFWGICFVPLAYVSVFVGTILFRLL